MNKILKMMAVGATALLSACGGSGANQQAAEEKPYESPAPEFSADSAFSYVAAQCAFGPRTMNSEGHDACGDYLAAKFESFGASVQNQYADLALYDGTPIKVRNIIASYNQDSPRRILICAHWDTRPWADHDRNEANHKTPIDGANDGASGVGEMLEIARQIQQKTPAVGVDLICFDAEDSGVAEWDTYDGSSDETWCIGSRYWATQARSQGYSARFGILLDMVGGINTLFHYEGFSMDYAPQIVDKVWAAAHRIGMGEYFLTQPGGYITDDHRPVNEIARIPCIDIIGGDRIDRGFCSTWHTMNDNIKHIDKSLLKAAGQTVLEVIYTE